MFPNLAKTTAAAPAPQQQTSRGAGMRSCVRSALNAWDATLEVQGIANLQHFFATVLGRRSNFA